MFENWCFAASVNSGDLECALNGSFRCRHDVCVIFECYFVYYLYNGTHGLLIVFLILQI